LDISPNNLFIIRARLRGIKLLTSKHITDRKKARSEDLQGIALVQILGGNIKAHEDFIEVTTRA
jgi:hypothetical protein